MIPPRPWTVLDHGPLERLTENVWTVDGALPNMGLRRRMTLVKLRDGRVLVHNAVPLAEGLMREIEAWGEPALLVVPNGFHRLDANPWKARYPRSTVWCPRGGLAKVEEAVSVDGTYDLFPRLPELSVESLEGGRAASGEGVFLAVDPAGRAVAIFNDALFNHPHGDGVGGFVMKLLGSTGGPRVTPLFKLVGVADRRRMAAHLRHLATREGLGHLVPGHGLPVTLDAPGVLRQVADALSPP